MFTNTLFFISTPENVYLDKNISILGGLEAEILTRVVCGLCQPFLNWPPLKSNIFLSFKNVLFCYKWSSKYIFRHRYSEYLWTRSWHKDYRHLSYIWSAIL